MALVSDHPLHLLGLRFPLRLRVTVRQGFVTLHNEIATKKLASGAVYTQADRAPAATSTTGSVLHHIEHCPLCISHAGSVGLPPPFSSPLPVITGHDHYPPLFYQAPRVLFAWLAASPRGPPSAA